MRKALITGVRGQDGSYLAELLLARGYEVVGTTHRTAQGEEWRVNGSVVVLKRLDLTDHAQIKAMIGELQPDELYHLAARSSSSQLFDDPIATAEINGVAAVRMLEAIREVSPKTRFCQAASSEIFAGSRMTPQDERTPYSPVNAYGAAKAYAANMVGAYRAQHALYACTAILFNHESPRRDAHYVSRKISRAVAMIASGRAGELELGSLDSRRDWGFAGDYARAMCLMLQGATPGDYVIATGATRSVREFCEIAFAHAGLDYRHHVKLNPHWVTRAEPVELRGDPSKIRTELGWQPSVDFPELVRMMVDADMAEIQSTP